MVTFYLHDRIKSNRQRRRFPPGDPGDRRGNRVESSSSIRIAFPLILPRSRSASMQLVPTYPILYDGLQTRASRDIKRRDSSLYDSWYQLPRISRLRSSALAFLWSLSLSLSLEFTLDETSRWLLRTATYLTTCAGNWLRTVTSDRTVHNNSSPSLSFRTRRCDITG